ncbi:mangetout [Dermacentor variabilis]|uniref:mangetout n=1 Tax=Dermacentor variabilis TaxID=34621 RepID=UPI003F5BF0AC
MARVVLPVLLLLLLVRPPPPAGCAVAAAASAASAAGVPVWPVKRAVVIEGDVMLGGLMMVHEREDRLTCGPIMPQGGIQALECMLFTLDWVNRQGYPFSLGAYVLDDCDKDTYGLEQAVDFIKGSISNIDDGTYRCPDGSSPDRIKQTVISGVLGAASSVTSIQVANLLRLFKIPQVSFFSTSPELSNKKRFEYFLRTVPSDESQVKAIVGIVTLLKWTYVSILYEESTYGNSAFDVLEKELTDHNVCIATKEKLTKDSGVASERTYDDIIGRLLSKPRARGVIIFGSDQEVAGVMRAVRRNNATSHFAWIGSDGWSARELVSHGNELQVEGTLSVQPTGNAVRGFDEYFRALTPSANYRNPWFIEFWEHFFQCKWNGSLVTPFNQHHQRSCTGEERISDNKAYKLEAQLQFVSNAVLAFAYALRKMHEEICGNVTGLCDSMRPVNGTDLLSYLKNVTFQGLSDDHFRFSDSGDGPARYNILHFKQVKPGRYRWVPVGQYVDGTLHLQLAELQFRLGSSELPRSVCSDPCPRGSAQKMVDNEQCCWHCVRCSGYTFAAENGVCADCAPGTLPDAHHERCVPVPESHMSPSSPLAVATLVLAALGTVFTAATLLIFLRHIDTPVVRASGRELCFVLLGGVCMCQGTALLLVQRPSTVMCGAQRAALGLCFAVVYSSVLAKAVRIHRIFHAGRRSAQRPGCISPRSQLALCGALVSVQGLVATVWLALNPPRAVHHHPTREDNLLVCLASVNLIGYTLSLIYPFMLVIVCTVYAVLTRKIPEAFNESKYIGFAMYATCVIWLAFLPIYLTTWHHVLLNLTTMAMAVSLSGTVTLICFFFPKLYIIVLHPEKNVRQSMMAKYGTLKNRVESATQSDVDYEMSDKQRSACSLVSTSSRASIATQTDDNNFYDMDVQL